MNTYKKTAHLANIWFDGAIISTSTYKQFFVVVASSQSSNKLVVEIKISISFPHTVMLYKLPRTPNTSPSIFNFFFV